MEAPARLELCIPSGIPGPGKVWFGSGSCPCSWLPLGSPGCCQESQTALEPGGASLGKGSVFIPGISPCLHTGNSCSCFSCRGRERRFHLSQINSFVSNEFPFSVMQDRGAQPRPASGGHLCPKSPCLLPKSLQDNIQGTKPPC